MWCVVQGSGLLAGKITEWNLCEATNVIQHYMNIPCAHNRHKPHQHVGFVCLILFNFSRAHVLFITLMPFLRQHHSCCQVQKIELLGCTRPFS